MAHNSGARPERIKIAGLSARDNAARDCQPLPSSIAIRQGKDVAQDQKSHVTSNDAVRGAG